MTELRGSFTMELSKAKFSFGYSELISHRFAPWEYHACLANIKTHRCFRHFGATNYLT